MAAAARTPALAAITRVNLLNGLADMAAQIRRFTVKICCGAHGVGSGIVWQADGLVVTNAHVADGAGLRVETADGRTFPAALAASSRRQDLALLQVTGARFPTLERLRRSPLRPGELAIALGNPMGHTGAMSVGVIHAVGPVEGLPPQDWIQADVMLAPGNSGGPLTDAAGRVIGVNSMVARGLGLAIPVARVEAFLAAAGR